MFFLSLQQSIFSELWELHNCCWRFQRRWSGLVAWRDIKIRPVQHGFEDPLLRQLPNSKSRNIVTRCHKFYKSSSGVQLVVSRVILQILPAPGHTRSWQVIPGHTRLTYWWVCRTKVGPACARSWGVPIYPRDLLGELYRGAPWHVYQIWMDLDVLCPQWGSKVHWCGFCIY